ncbi:hypothetical protein F2Q70_00006997 [Brassica cretica]|uniref:Uncharacterized protein n=1 Tax=Brassica cretica TaxID=69181 RepID=A0A8S9LWU8_BRACR|nr:hypothetical protein F2Q70_00006997 [Brassica cretica]
MDQTSNFVDLLNSQQDTVHPSQAPSNLGDDPTKRPPGVKAAKGASSKKSIAEDQALAQLETMCSIKEKDLAVKEKDLAVKERVSKMSLLDSSKECAPVDGTSSKECAPVDGTSGDCTQKSRVCFVLSFVLLCHKFFEVATCICLYVSQVLL